jgi:antirestriction protein ArdC
MYATWAHECIHSTGHSKRLDRKMTGRKDSQSYAREELVAELGAFLVCNRLNISSSASNHASYLKGYASVLKEGPKVLFKVLSDATKASNLILGQEVQQD